MRAGGAGLFASLPGRLSRTEPKKYAFSLGGKNLGFPELTPPTDGWWEDIGQAGE